MEPIKVFLSSTYREDQLRQAAIEAIRSLPGFTPLVVEESTSEATVKKAVLQTISDADLVVLILGRSLGSPIEGDTFHLKEEYDVAKHLGKPVLIMMLGEKSFSDFGASKISDQHHFPALMNFRQDLLATNVAGMFDSQSELRKKLQSALMRVAAERFASTFRIAFDPDLSEHQVRAAFQALADYYRACGGLGLAVDFEREEITVGDLLHV